MFFAQSTVSIAVLRSGEFFSHSKSIFGLFDVHYSNVTDAEYTAFNCLFLGKEEPGTIEARLIYEDQDDAQNNCVASLTFPFRNTAEPPLIGPERKGYKTVVGGLIVQPGETPTAEGSIFKVLLALDPTREVNKLFYVVEADAFPAKLPEHAALALRVTSFPKKLDHNSV